MTDTQFAALSALIIDLNGFQERTADALERLADILESQEERLANIGKVDVPLTDAELDSIANAEALEAKHGPIPPQGPA